jgi:hypothetical protein
MNSSNIKNYTSSVPADKSILKIETIIVGIGATNITKEYENGKVCAISFAVKRGEYVHPFKLPARKESIKKLLLSQYKRPKAAQIVECERQAERTAWKNVKEWVELQATMIKLEQVEFMEVFLPYAYSLEHGKTLYELSKESDFKLLN